MVREEMVEILYSKYGVGHSKLAKIGDFDIIDLYRKHTEITRKEFETFLKVAEHLNIVEVEQKFPDSSTKFVGMTDHGIGELKLSLGL
jgi:hypothetical protein